MAGLLNWPLRMIRFLRASGRALRIVGRFRPLVWLLILLWLFDVAVRMATDKAWFNSLERGALWQNQLAWQIGAFAAFAVMSLAASVFVMRAVARPVEEAPEPPLPHALSGWAGARTRATRWGWLVLLAGTVGIGRTLSSSWPDFALSGARSGSWNEAGADFWVWHAPALADALGAVWRFGLLLGLVAILVGALRALPFLAARQSIAPRRWLRTLILIARALLGIRALGFAFEVARALSNLSNQSEGGRAMQIVLGVAGTLGCLGCALMLRRPRPVLALWATLCLALPPLLSGIAAPFSGGREPASDDARALGEAVLVRRGAAPTQVPLWDEATLGRVMRAHLSWPDKRLIAWESVGITSADGARQGRADVVGAPPVADAWAGHGWAEEGALAWRSLDLPTLSPSRQGLPLGPLFYGLNARPLLASDTHSGGVPLEAWAWKIAWAWRLRDPLLLVEGARAKRLLVFRGARETGERLAPFWTWDEATPRRDARTGSAYFESVAYASTPNLPRATRQASGFFGGQNAVRPVAVLRMDSRDGRVQIAPFAPTSINDHNPFVARWKSASPMHFDAPAQNAPTPLLESARADGTPLVWMLGDAGWQKRALPVEVRGAVEKKLREFDALARDKARDATAPTGRSAAAGATPSLWRQGRSFFLARPFFTPSAGDIGVTNSDTGSVTSNTGSVTVPGFKGLCAGELGAPIAGWGQTPETAFTDATARQKPALNGTQAATNPVATPLPAPPLDVRETARQAVAAQDAALDALKAGRYVESQRQSERARQLLEPLTRR
jgi:hypothetical protein